MDTLRHQLGLNEVDLPDDVRTFLASCSSSMLMLSRVQDISVALSTIIVGATQDSNPQYTLDQVYRAIEVAQLIGDIVRAPSLARDAI